MPEARCSTTCDARVRNGPWCTCGAGEIRPVRCCDLHDLEEPCGRNDHCCDNCPMRGVD